MNGDLEEMVGTDADMRRFVATLKGAPQVHVAAGFASRVMAAVRAERRRTLLSAPTVFALAASLVAILGFASLFCRSLPRSSSYAAWAEPALTVRLAPYNPAEWYQPLACETGVVQDVEEPLCTREALAAWRP